MTMFKGFFGRSIVFGFFLVSVSIYISFFGPVIWAQSVINRGVAEYVPIDNAGSILHGSIIGFSGNAYRITGSAYSEDVVGVATLNPSVVISSVGSAGSVPIVTTGTSEVLVSGEVSSGDFITSSDTPGVGKRAEQPGFTVGRALASSADGQSVEGSDAVLIPITVDVRFTWPPGAGVQIGALLSSPGEALATLPRPVRYLAAILIVLISVTAGYWIYHRMAASTVTAMGRNPMARRSIIVLAGVQTAGTLVLVLAGFALAYFVLVL